jgi:hypothetical protein
VDKDDNLESGIRVEMDKFDSVMIEESAEEVTSRKAKSALEKEANTTISFVLCVGMSSPIAGHHYSTVRFGRK